MKCGDGIAWGHTCSSMPEMLPLLAADLIDLGSSSLMAGCSLQSESHSAFTFESLLFRYRSLDLNPEQWTTKGCSWKWILFNQHPQVMNEDIKGWEGVKYSCSRAQVCISQSESLYFLKPQHFFFLQQ